MAATCRDIVVRAYRMLGVSGLAATVEAEEADYAMEALQSIYDTWFASGMFGTLCDYHADGQYGAIVGQRIIKEGNAIDFPVATTDEPIPDNSAIAIVDGGEQKNYIYIGGAWIAVSDLTLNSPAPLASRGEHGLAAVLAIDIAAPFDAQPNSMTIRRAGSFNTALSLKRGSTRDVFAPDYY